MPFFPYFFHLMKVVFHPDRLSCWFLDFILYLLLPFLSLILQIFFSDKIRLFSFPFFDIRNAASPFVSPVLLRQVLCFSVPARKPFLVLVDVLRLAVFSLHPFFDLIPFDVCFLPNSCRHPPSPLEADLIPFVVGAFSCLILYPFGFLDLR